MNAACPRCLPKYYRHPFPGIYIVQYTFALPVCVRAFQTVEKKYLRLKSKGPRVNSEAYR